MTDIPEDVMKLAREMREDLFRLEGGLWKAEGYAIFGDWHASGAIASVRTGLSAFPTARHIARCSPDNIRALLDTIDSLLADRTAQAERMARLEEALKPIVSYVKARHRSPLKGIGDSVHMIHGGTEFEAELRFSDLETLARALSQEGSDA